MGRRKPFLFKVIDSMAKASARAAKERVREQNQRIRQAEREERDIMRRLKQAEMAQRRANREYEKAMRDQERERQRLLREQEKAAKLFAKQQAQEQLEAEMAEIESDNTEWTTVEALVDHIVTLDDVNETLSKCDYEQQNTNATNCMFQMPPPAQSVAANQAQLEANSKFDINAPLAELQKARDLYSNLSFNMEEPTLISVRAILNKEAESQLNSWLPWKQKRLRKEYVETYLNPRYEEMHEEWEKLKKDYDEMKAKLLADMESKNLIVEKVNNDKKNFLTKRTQEIMDVAFKEWKNERDAYYNNLRANLQDMISGDKDYIVTAVDSIFPNDDLPMEYFVDIAYDETTGKALVDLDLPEIEDVPQQKIAVTPSGKRTIRQKTQTDLRNDYAHCIFGLAMYVAHNIFNVSLKIQEIEISAYTQRKGDNSALATDQYVFLVDFGRDAFSVIDYQNHSSLEIMEAFKRHYNMTKTYDLKEIDLSTAYGKMETFTPADITDFV